MNLISTLRSYRIFKIALFDLITAILGTYLLLKYMFKGRQESFYISWTIVITLPIGIVVHKLLGIETQLNKYLGIA